MRITMLLLSAALALPLSTQANTPKRKPKIVTTIDLSEVVRRSPFIFRARVMRVGHVYGVSRKTQVKYTRHHRVEVEVGVTYRGGAAVKAYRDSKKSKRIWLQRRVAAPWAKLVDHYYSQYDLAAAQVGDEFIAFMQWTTESPTRDGAEVLLLGWAETSAVARRLGPMVTKGHATDDAQRRKLGSCATPKTFLFDGKCLMVAKLRKVVTCAKGTALTIMPTEPTPRAFCALPDGTFEGPFFSWRNDGDISMRGAYTKGQRSGTWTDYGRRGLKIYRREYKDNVEHGRTVRYHLNGQPRLLGYQAKGMREGRWIQYDKTGAEIGSFEMASGSGSEKTFHSKGKQASETVFYQGLRHGKHKRWHDNGKTALTGTFVKGRPSGMWWYTNADGKFARAECYRSNGGLKWETPVESAADPKRCAKKRN